MKSITHNDSSSESLPSDDGPTARANDADVLPGSRAPSPVWGNVLVALGVAGLIMSVVVVVLGLRAVDRTGATVARSLELTADAIIAVEDSVAAAADSVTIAADGIDTLVSAAQNTEDSLGGVATLADDTASALGAEIPEAVEAIRTTMPALIESAELVEDALSTLSFLGVGFDPQNPPAASLREVDERLADVAEVLRDGSGQISVIGADLSDLEADVASLTFNLERLDANLDRATSLVGTYTATTRNITALVDDTAAELETQRRDGQMIVVLFGVVLALLHAVPIALGIRERQASRRFGSTAHG